MMLRRLRRGLALAFSLGGCALRYGATRLRGPLTLQQRAFWLQSASRGVLASLQICCDAQGALPRSGLVVSNHLSYLDIVIFAAAMPCVFVSKREVNKWPFFGWAARAGGTIFVDRASAASANSAADAIAQKLADPIPVLLFPEGTSTDGSAVQRFHARLFQPAARACAPVTAAAIAYAAADGAEERELCWYGDAGFLSHLWRVLGSADFSAHLRFGQPRLYSDPRAAAAEAHIRVMALRQDCAQPARPSKPAIFTSCEA
jgi:1-acyl-sn-glycerol-3-phosphate acyltransferase